MSQKEGREEVSQRADCRRQCCHGSSRRSGHRTQSETKIQGKSRYDITLKPTIFCQYVDFGAKIQGKSSYDMKLKSTIFYRYVDFGTKI